MRIPAYYPGTDRPHSIRRDGQMYYYQTDALGSVTGLVDSSNNLVNRYQYTPWGELEAGESTYTKYDPLGFTARERDDETRLYYYRARYYDPQLGRFISEDPIGLAGGPNVYAYVGNNPINNTDPYGLTPEKPIRLPGLVGPGRCLPGQVRGPDRKCRDAPRTPETGSTPSSGREDRGNGRERRRERERGEANPQEPLPSCEVAGDKTVNSLVSDLLFLGGARGVQKALGRARDLTGSLVVVMATRASARREAVAWGATSASPWLVGGIYNEGEAWYLKLPLLGSADKFATMAAVCLNQ